MIRGIGDLYDNDWHSDGGNSACETCTWKIASKSNPCVVVVIYTMISHNALIKP